MAERDVVIERLNNVPQFADLIAEWNMAEWPEECHDLGYIDVPDYRKRVVETYLRNHDFRVPVCYVVCNKERTNCYATVTIDFDDLPSKRHLSPWLISAYVAPPYRGRGYIQTLLKRAVLDASLMGIQKLYLWARTERLQNLYKKVGTTRCVR